MDADGGSERWGGDIDFNEWSPAEPTTGDGPRWEPTPPSRWSGRRIGWIVGGALAATLIGVGGVLGLLALVGGDEDPGGSIASGPTTQDGGTAAVGGGGADAPPPADPASLEWYAVDGTLGFVERIALAPDGTMYALSTAPGRGLNVWPPPKAIYQSVDGEAWDFAVLADDISGADMALLGDTIYLIGTAPSIGGGFDEVPVIVVNSSTDGGVSWDQQSLPTVAAPPAVPTDGWTDTSMHIAASSGGMVAVVQTNFWIDYWSLVPQELLNEFNDVVATETGVDIVDYSIFNQLEEECAAAGGFGGGSGDGFGEEEEVPEPCRRLMEGDVEPAVVESLTWEDLGVEGGQPSFSEIFVSSDGAQWEAIESPFDPTERLAQLYSTGSGYIAAQWGRFGGNRIWLSPDGRTWEKAADFPALDWVAAAGSVGGDAVVLGSSQGQPVAVWADGPDWETLNISSQLEELPVGRQMWLSAGAVGPMGVVAILHSEGEGVGPAGPTLLHGTAPDMWNQIPLDGLVGQGFGYSDWAVVGPSQILARYVESGPQGEINLQLIGTLD